MTEWLKRAHARLDRWLWGNPQQQTPGEIREAAHRVLNEAAALTALVDRIHRREREKEWTNSTRGS